MKLSSALTLEMLGKPFLLEKRIVLLHAIKEHGSISKAAKAVPMSYKSAWEAVDTMNSLSTEAIVLRETGGKDGGGTTITHYGDILLKNYAYLKEEHTRFLTRLSELTDIDNGTFKTMGRLSLQLSARNQIPTEVMSIESDDVNASIVLKLKSGQQLKSTITKEAVENLDIEVGEKVTAIFKSHAVMVSIHENENSLKGIVNSMERDRGNIKITVDIGSLDKVVSVVVHTSSLEDVQIGSFAYVSIHSNDVMLGK